MSGNTAQVTAIGGTTDVRGATLSGPGVNLAGLQVDIPSWLSVEHTTLAGGAPELPPDRTGRGAQLGRQPRRRRLVPGRSPGSGTVARLRRPRRAVARGSL